MGTHTLREEFEAAVPIRETEARSYYSYRDAKRSTVPPAWEWQENAPSGCWHGGFESREAAFVDAVHALLCKAQEYGQPEHYARLMLLAWTLPLPLKYLELWERFRPAPKRVSPKIPDACRAPAQALAWGMDPALVRTAKARRAVVELTSDERKPGRTTYGANWLYRLTRGGKAMDDRDFVAHSAFMMDLSRVLAAIRREGLAETFGVWTEPDAATDGAREVAHV